MKYRYFLDGNLIDEPIGSDRLVTTIKRDRNLKAILRSQDATLGFVKSGYTYLYNLFNAGYCGEASLLVQRSCDGNIFSDFYLGTIYSKYIEIDEKRCIISTKIEDTSYFAKIFNNKSLECLPHVGVSKNKADIDVADIYKIRFFKPANGAYYGILNGAGQERTCAGYKVYDIFRFLIDFMSDGTVEFDSTLFGQGGKREGMMLTYGLVLSTVSTGLSTSAFERNFPRITFDKFLKEVNRICNLGFYIDLSGSRPKLWIEEYDDLFENTDVVTLSGIDELKTRILQDELYSKLQIGTESILLDGEFPETIDLQGFKNEVFNLTGVCNIDKTLDLTGEYIVSSNVIGDAVVNGSDTWDDAPVFVDCEFYSTGVYSAIQTNTFNTAPPYFYNQAFANDKITERFLKHIPNDIVFYLGDQSDFRFRAASNAYTPYFPHTGTTDFIYRLENVPYQNDSIAPNYDTNNVYDNATYEAIIPLSGQYTFYVAADFEFLYYDIAQDAFSTVCGQDYYVTYKIFLDQYDVGGYMGGAGTLIQSIEIFNYTQKDRCGHLNRRLFTANHTVNTTAGHTFIVSVEFSRTHHPVTNGQTLVRLLPTTNVFAINQTLTGGGEYKQTNQNDIAILTHEFKYPLRESDLDLIIANPKGRIAFSRSGQSQRVGYIEKIAMDHHSGIADILLSSSKTINNAN